MFLPLACQFQVLGGRGLGLFDNTMKDDDLLVVEVEKHAGDPVVESGTDFPQPVPQGIYERLSNGPCPLDGLNVGSDDHFVFGGKILKPLPRGFPAVEGPEEPHFQGTWGRCGPVVTAPKKVQTVKFTFFGTFP